MNILLAEDDPNIVKIAQLILEKVGKHKVDAAFDGVQALEKALANDYDLIILDGMMPGYPGLEVCRLFREKRPNTLTKVIFLSAKSSQKDINEFLSVGTGYIQKPFEPQNLCNLIDAIVKKAA